MTNSKKIRLLRLGQSVGVLIGLLVLAVILSILTPLFLTIDNLLNVALQSATYILVATGMTFVVVTGGIDLSVGSIAALAGVVMALAMKAGVNPGISVFLGLIVGIVCGLLNGLLVAKANLPPFIVTLATMSVIRGLALILTGGIPIYGFPAAFRWLGTGRVGVIPVAALISLLIAALGGLIFKKTRIGHYATAIGDNEEATRLCGINVSKYKALVYVISGLTAAMAAVIITGRLNTAEPLAGYMIEMDAVAAVVMGGTSLAGGKGSILGTTLGALLMGVMRNGLNLMSVQSNYQQLAMGAIILIAVLLDKIRGKSRA
ncbi:MAG TPA: ribose ABC transporter permease [Firmicutes bacterium]|jgi:ribose/xylose/arabinose/galactoside ABC-type transport system permease subunit|nr:ribose ABC transporter permease [Bacillota bacterium]HAW70696.1 ribose ABC transporter permease [Bacillota bacterium]HAZ20753.1 ribose ABC transporter permease [Bacillota bacterium]HBE05225.1 ribose ABC transporter permease [Bacillota bacterium]HBL51293.1 ribose ABC transporter permease [Bacillota bacterium]